MTGLCENGHEVHWRNTRGSRKPETCYLNDCRAAVHAARYNTETHQYERANSSGRPGTKTENCAVCGRKRRVPSGNAKRLDRDVAFKVWGDKGYEPKEIKAGSAVCWSHQLWPNGEYISLVEFGSHPDDVPA